MSEVLTTIIEVALRRTNKSHMQHMTPPGKSAKRNTTSTCALALWTWIRSYIAGRRNLRDALHAMMLSMCPWM